MTNSQKQKNGNDSKNYQAGRDIIYNETKVELVLYPVEELSKKLLNSVFGDLPNETKQLIENNQQSYYQGLLEKLGLINKQHEELKTIIESPDFQYVLKESIKSASRSSSKELHNNLSSLIVQRINCDEHNLQRIVYNEAIATVEKLTTNNLKILTFFFLITRTKINGLKDVNDLMVYFNTKLLPFITTKVAQIEFDHLAYTGCAYFSIAARSFDETIKSNYFDLFEKIDIPNNFISENTTYLHLKAVWNPPISNMNLTSVGVALALIHYEQVIKEKLEVNTWLSI